MQGRFSWSVCNFWSRRSIPHLVLEWIFLHSRTITLVWQWRASYISSLLLKGSCPMMWWADHSAISAKTYDYSRFLIDRVPFLLKGFNFSLGSGNDIGVATYLTQLLHVFTMCSGLCHDKWNWKTQSTNRINGSITRHIGSSIAKLFDTIFMKTT
jgi:hypothetical protein